ncbi:MAG TPA: cell wall metabolism sensor histidine kinase WalK [Clostridiaceae bacterium]|nr:cell wall metabolism sensor histidine kinase WalK [Clostridiaceae bacterium]
MLGEHRMFLKSLQWRLVAFFCIVTFCLIIPISFLLNKSVEYTYYDIFIQDIQRVFKGWDVTSSNPSLMEIQNGIRNNPNVFYIMGENRSYTIVGRKDNTIYFSSDPSYDEMSNGKFLNGLLQSENFLKGLAGTGDGDNNRLVRYDNRDFFDYAKPIGDYVLYIRFYKDEWQRTINVFNRIIFSSLLFALTFAIILGYLLSKTITVPIVRLMHKAESIARGDFSQVLEVKSDDEIGKLTEAFNYMSKNLRDTLAEISSEKNKIETILNYMTDGVVAFNKKGEVIHTNPAFIEMVGEENFEESFNDYTRRLGLDFTIEDIMQQKTINGKEFDIEIGDRAARIYFAVFEEKDGEPGGIIAVVQDVTRQMKLEKMRREFVANVSHELRTPLTSIKSYSETLLDGALEDPVMSRKFLSVINTEADRMTRLVKDLLQLSSHDNNQAKLNIQKIYLTEIVKNCVEKMRIEADGKNQILEYHAGSEIPVVHADRDRIEQVIVNLLSNAIKYTPAGGKIVVDLGVLPEEVFIKIVDTGIGIPEEDIPRIFERFYRVDKARSREMGGTGLGLSIAKEIVEAHSGQITIESQLGKGTEVMVKLPIRNKDNDIFNEGVIQS